MHMVGLPTVMEGKCVVESALVQSKSILLDVGGWSGMMRPQLSWVRDMAYCRLAGASEQMSKGMDSQWFVFLFL